MNLLDLFESQQQCPECGGPAFSDLLLAEKKDACYHKVKATAKVWPSAYASGRLVQCRKKGADNYGNQSEGVAEGSFGQNVMQYPRGSVVADKHGNRYTVLGHQGRTLVVKGVVDGKRVMLFPHQLQQGVAEGLNEMDKSQTPPGRDGDIDWTKKQIHLGPEHVIKAKDVAKHALKALDKTMKKSHADTPKKKGVAEGSLNELSKDTLKSYAKKAVPDMQSSQNKSKAEYSKAASAKDDETANKHYDAAKQAKDRTEKRMAGVAGAIKRFNKEGVAEGSQRTIFTDEELDAINQYLDDDLSFQGLRTYPGLIRKIASHFGIASIQGHSGEMSFYDRLAQARAEDDIPQQGVAEAFGPLPRDSQQIRLGRHTVDIERVGLNNDYISFAWHDSQGQEHYEEVAVGDLGSYDDLIKKIKQEISYQERQYTDQGVAEGDDNFGKPAAMMQPSAAAAKTAQDIVQTQADQNVIGMAKFAGAVPAQGVAEVNNEKIGGRYDPEEFDSMVQRLKKLAGAGPMKTVYDPQKRVYRNMPVAQQPTDKK